jgi:DNA-binding transcriptional LysR family regulator
MQELIYLAVFKRVAEEKSFTAVAHNLGLTPSAVSRQISRLEDHLGVQLLVRTTRHVRLTQAGQSLYERCSRSLAELEEAKNFVSREGDVLHGSLRICSTPCFGKLHVAPAVADFLERYPQMSVDVSLGYSEEGLIGSGLDVLITASNVRGANISLQKLAPIWHVICASPEYLRRRGIPKTPRDLIQHNCLILAQPRPRYEWRFASMRDKKAVRVSGNYQTNSMEALHNAAVKGLGIARLPNYVAGPDLRSGKLISILFPRRDGGYPQKNAAVSETTMKAYYSRGRFPSPKTKAFIDFLTARFSENYDWEKRADVI